MSYVRVQRVRTTWAHINSTYNEQCGGGGDEVITPSFSVVYTLKTKKLPKRKDHTPKIPSQIKDVIEEREKKMWKA